MNYFQGSLSQEFLLLEIIKCSVSYIFLLIIKWVNNLLKDVYIEIFLKR